MPEFGGVADFIEFADFFVFGHFSEESESLAGAGFDQGGDHQAVEDFFGDSLADEVAEFVGTGVLVAGEAGSAAVQDSDDLGEVVGFVAGD